MPEWRVSNGSLSLKHRRGGTEENQSAQSLSWHLVARLERPLKCYTLNFRPQRARAYQCTLITHTHKLIILILSLFDFNHSILFVELFSSQSEFCTKKWANWMYQRQGCRSQAVQTCRLCEHTIVTPPSEWRSDWSRQSQTPLRQCPGNSMNVGIVWTNSTRNTISV